MQDDDPFADIPIRQPDANDPFADIPVSEPSGKSELSTWEKAKGLGRSVAQGATFGFGEELEALPYLLPGGETREQAIKRIRGEMSQYREEYPKTAIAAEIGGGLLTGGVGGARAAGSAGLRAAAGRLAASNVAQGVLGGVGAAEGGFGERVTGGLVGGAVGGIVPGVVSRIPGAKAVAGKAGEYYDMGRSAVARALDATPLAAVGRFIEPTDLRVIAREATALPGSVTGPTASSLGPDIGPLQAAEEATRASLGGARVEAAQRQLATQRAQAARQQAAVAATGRVAGVREAGRTRLSAAQQQREAAAEAQRLAEEAAYYRVQQQAQAGTAAIRGAKRQAEATTAQGAARQARLEAEQAGLEPQIRAAKTARKQAAREAAEAELDALRGEAEQQIGGLIGGARGTTAAMQDAVRARQKEVGEQTYAQVRAMGAPAAPPMDVYGDILSDPAMASSFGQAVTRVERELGEALPRLQIGEETVPVISLEVMDQMRRGIVDRIPLGQNVTGLSASQRRALLNQINNLEERFLASYGDDAAAQALKTARGQYRQEFQRLEALRDGLGFGTVGTGKASGLITQSKKELDAFEKNLRALEAGDAFQQELAELTRAGARESFDRLMQRTPNGALGMARKLTQTEEGRRKVALVFGEDGLNTMLAFSKEAVGQRAKAAATKAGADAEQLVAQLTGRSERLGALSTRAGQQAKARAAETVGTTRTAMQEALEQVKQQERGTVAPLRQAARAARRTVGAERGQARMGVLQAQQAEQRALTPLREAFEQARGETFAARERRNALQAALVGATEARRGAQAQGRTLAKAGTALGGEEQAAEFLSAVAPNLTPQQQQRTREVMGSIIQREIRQAQTAGAPAQKAVERLRELQQNPAVRQFFGDEIDRVVAGLRPSFGTRAPQLAGASARGVLGRFGGSLIAPEENE